MKITELRLKNDIDLLDKKIVRTKLHISTLKMDISITKVKLFKSLISDDIEGLKCDLAHMEYRKKVLSKVLNNLHFFISGISYFDYINTDKLNKMLIQLNYALNKDKIDFDTSILSNQINEMKIKVN